MRIKDTYCKATVNMVKKLDRALKSAKVPEVPEFAKSHYERYIAEMESLKLMQDAIKDWVPDDADEHLEAVLELEKDFELFAKTLAQAVQHCEKFGETTRKRKAHERSEEVRKRSNTISP